MNIISSSALIRGLDFGVERLVSLAGEMNFPWLMSNVKSSKTGELLAEGKEFQIIPWEGRKVSWSDSFSDSP